MIRLVDRRPPPLVVVLLTAAGAALVARALGAHEPRGLEPSQAWFAALILLAQFIWQGVQVAGQITLKILAGIVSSLWVFAKQAYNTALAIGRALQKGLKVAWGFLRTLYQDVLKPAWEKFFKLVDRVRGTLERVFKPVLKWLNTVRDDVLKFYEHWIRPILDIIDAVRQMLRVLETLHIDFAKKLDAWLGALEEKIDAPFRYVLGKINEIINVVNRVVTADGLFQRLALVRSLVRDVLYIDRILHNMRANPFTDGELSAIAGRNKPPKLADAVREFSVFADARGAWMAPDVAAARADFELWDSAN